jgi:deoxyhypusine synthase
MAGPSDTAQAAVFVHSENIDKDAIRIQGPDFNKRQDLESLLKSYATIGFQASGLSRAIEIIDKMVRPATTSCHS